MAISQGQISHKRLMIDKANARIVVLTAAASFIVVFSLVASYILFGQLQYQNRLIGKKKVALSQLHEDIDSTKTLVSQYQAFVSNSQNILGGDPNGNGNQDGDNAKLVLDALPSKYDFPALATSLEKLITDQGAVIDSMTGTDDEVAQAGVTSDTPEPVQIPFEVTVSGNYGDIKKVVDGFQRSIRPIQIQSMQLTGSEDKMSLHISAVTYYQPEKSLNIRMEVLK